MSANIIYVGNTVTINFTVLEDGEALDISDATTTDFIFVKNDGTELTESAEFATDGTDGVLTWQADTAFFDEAASWRVYAHLEWSASEVYDSDYSRITVKEGGK